MARYLTPNQLKLQSKGVKSVAARVANLRDLAPGISHDALVPSLASAFARCYGYDQPPAMEELRAESLNALPEINQYYEQLTAWEWRFGASPQFSHALPLQRFDWGSLDVRLDVQQGRVRDARIFSDALNIELVEALQAALVGVVYDAAELGQAVTSSAATAAVRAASPDGAAMVQDFGAWIARAIAQPATA